MNFSDETSLIIWVANGQCKMRHDIEVADENAAGSGIRAGST